MQVYDLIIIGAGPAGLSAALYAGRFRLNVLVLEKLSCGGQLILSSAIENYPGFPGGIATEDLIGKFKQQVEEVGVKIESEEALSISQSFKIEAPLYSVKTPAKAYETKTLIIASGAQAKRLGVGGEEKFIGRGVSYCATCDGPLARGKEVAVIGGGDRAIEEALFLTSYAKKVSIIHRRSELRASKILEEKAKSNPKIDFILDSVAEEITGQNKVEAIGVKNLTTGRKSRLLCQGVFIFVGIVPNTAFLKNLLETDEFGFIITGDNMQSSQDGVFAAGDCRRKSLYQVISACGDGAVAADSAHKYLLKQ